MNRRGRTGQVIDLVYLDEKRLRYVVPEGFKPAVVEQVLDVVSSAGEEVVQSYHMMPVCEETFAEVRSNEAGPAGNEDAHNP